MITELYKNEPNNILQEIPITTDEETRIIEYGAVGIAKNRKNIPMKMNQLVLMFEEVHPKQ